jgi:hypothetical protein
MRPTCVVALLMLTVTLGVGVASAQTTSTADSQSRAHAIAASFSKFKSVSKERHGIKKEKYRKVESEPAVRANPADYSGIYEVPELGFALNLTVDAKGAVSGSGYEALNESVRRAFTLRDGRVQGALLTATKVYADGGTERLEGAFMNRVSWDSPTDRGTSVFGFGTLGKSIEISGMTIDKFFYERSTQR